MFFVLFFSSLQTVFSGELDLRSKERIYFSRAVPNAANLRARLDREGEPWPNLGVRSLMDHVYVLAYAKKFLSEEPKDAPAPDWAAKLDVNDTIPLLKLLESMQDKDPKSPTYGNFRWYWRTPEVTDRNAVEFISAHAIPVRAEAMEYLPEESQKILERILKGCLEGVQRHFVRPDYTNIALKNAIQLVILGEMFERPEAIELGERRLRDILFAFWEHGIFEYNSPTYYAVNSDALQLGMRYVKKPEVRTIIETMLDYLWLDISLNWFEPARRQAGSQSRTYNYLYGVADIERLLEFAELVPFKDAASQPVRLSSFRGVYFPAQETLELTKKYPREVKQRWGMKPGQWRTTYILEDIALGTAGASYPNALQDMTLTVDLADYSDKKSQNPILSRNYFIPDGRNDPYGTVRYSTSSAGHQKALHLEPFWTASQRTCDALGIVLYNERTLRNPAVTDVVSHFVFRDPDEIRIENKTLSPGEPEAPNGVWIDEESTVILKYGSRVIGLKIPWTRTEKGTKATIAIVKDENEHGVTRLSVKHWSEPETDSLPLKDDTVLETIPGLVIWTRIGSRLETDEAYEKWCERFISENPKRLDIDKTGLELEIPGTDGPVKISARNLFTAKETLNYEPAPPNGILESNGKELGRPVLERISSLKKFADRLKNEPSISVAKTGFTEWDASIGIVYEESLIEKRNDTRSGKALRVNGPAYWNLDIPSKGPFFLWGRVLTLDSEHDSVFVEFSKIEGDENRPSPELDNDWHLGNSPDWRWVVMRYDRVVNPARIELAPGKWTLRLRAREQDALFDRLILSTDPNRVPK